MEISTDVRKLMLDINAVRKEQAEERGDFFISPVVPLICFSALVKVADDSDYWEDDGESRNECLLGPALLAQFSRLMVLVSTEHKAPVTNEKLADIFGIETTPDLLALIATAIGMSPAWPGSDEIH